MSDRHVITEQSQVVRTSLKPVHQHDQVHLTNGSDMTSTHCAALPPILLLLKLLQLRLFDGYALTLDVDFMKDDWMEFCLREEIDVLHVERLSVLEAWILPVTPRLFGM